MIRFRFLVLLAIGISVFYSSFSPYWLQRKLAHRGVKTTARVAEKYPSNHEYVRFTYVVAGRKYEALAKAGYGNPPFDALRVGDKVSAIYLPEDPSVALMGNIEEIESESLWGLAFVNVVFVPSIVIGLWLRARSQARDHNQPTRATLHWQVKVGLAVVVITIVIIIVLNYFGFFRH